MWLFKQRVAIDCWEYCMSNAKPYYCENDSQCKYFKESDDYYYAEVDNWVVPCRHHRYSLPKVTKEIFEKVTFEGGPVEFDFVVDNVTPQWFVERKGEQLFASNRCCVVKDLWGRKKKIILHDIFLKPTMLPEVKEEDGVVGISMVIK